VRIYQVKAGSDGGSDNTAASYIKKETWRLRDIRIVDGVNPRKVRCFVVNVVFTYK
jgi:hypothetical protein